MARRDKSPADPPPYDRALIRELARCFARAAVDDLLREQSKPTPDEPHDEDSQTQDEDSPEK